jgi:hypothetical protein
MSAMTSPMHRAGPQLLVALLLIPGLGCACSSVRVVSRTPNGGAIAIPNNSDQWPTYYRSRAERLMRRICPTGYVIDHEEVVTAESVQSRQQAPNDTVEFEYNGALERLSRYHRQEHVISFHRAPPIDNMPSEEAPPQR